MLEENPAIVKVANSWIIMNPGGGPTPDKPDTTWPRRSLVIRFCRFERPGGRIAAFYADAKSKEAQFVTEPLDRKANFTG